MGSSWPDGVFDDGHYGGALEGRKTVTTQVTAATAKDYQDLQAAYDDVCRERDGLRKRLEKAVAALEVAAAQMYTLAEIADGKEIGPL